MRFTPQDEEFRAELRAWLQANLTGEFAGLRAGGPGREHERFPERLAWNRHLAAAGWTCLGWPAEFGGRGASLARQVIFHEEYARAGAPARVTIVGEELLGPTLIAFGTPEQQARFLPPIRNVTRRSGPPWPTWPTGASCWPARSPARRAARACPTCWSRCASRG